MTAADGLFARSLVLCVHFFFFFVGIDRRVFMSLPTDTPYRFREGGQRALPDKANARRLGHLEHQTRD